MKNFYQIFFGCALFVGFNFVTLLFVENAAFAQSRRSVDLNNYPVGTYDEIRETIRDNPDTFRDLIRKAPEALGKKFVRISWRPLRQLRFLATAAPDKPDIIAALMALPKVEAAIKNENNVAAFLGDFPEVRRELVKLNPESEMYQAAISRTQYADDDAKKKSRKRGPRKMKKDILENLTIAIEGGRVVDASLNDSAEQSSKEATKFAEGLKKNALWDYHLVLLKNPAAMRFGYAHYLSEFFGRGQRGTQTTSYFANAILNLPERDRRPFLLTGILPSNIRVPEHLLPYIEFLKTQFENVDRLETLLQPEQVGLFDDLLKEAPWVFGRSLDRLAMRRPAFLKTLAENHQKLLSVLEKEEVRSYLGLAGVHRVLTALSAPTMQQYRESSLALVAAEEALARCGLSVGNVATAARSDL